MPLYFMTKHQTKWHMFVKIITQAYFSNKAFHKTFVGNLMINRYTVKK